jgi:hypothetical protein
MTDEEHPGAPEERRTPPPGVVHEHAERAVEAVRRAVGVLLDYRPETLPLLDHYLAGVPRDQPATLLLVAAMSGAYFGEVLRRAFGGEWDAEDADPARWTVELSGGIRLTPAAFAAAAILAEDGEDATFDVPADHRAAVEAALEAQGAVPAAEYYSLAGRHEALLAIATVVAAVRQGSH